MARTLTGLVLEPAFGEAYRLQIQSGRKPLVWYVVLVVWPERLSTL